MLMMSTVGESEGSDHEVEEEFGYDLEHENEAFKEDGFDSTDDEFREARERKKTNVELFEISQQVQREAVAGASLLEEGRIDGGDQVVENGYLSDYANCEEDELTPDEDDDGEDNACRRKGNRMVVSDGTDWTKFEWWVGHRFPNTKSLKDAARPHWPAKDIIETVKRAYKVIIKKELVYKSIIAAVSKLLPKAEHRHRARHIYVQWHKTFRGDKFQQVFWRAAKAYNMADINDALEDMGKVDVIVNNLAETFNGYIITTRTKHLLYMLEEIRTALMQRLAMKIMELEKNTSMICPGIQAKLEKAKKESTECNVDLPLIPPPIKIRLKRPSKNRIKDPLEDPKKPEKLTKHGIKMTCFVCKSNTHNKRTCPNKGKEGGEATNATKSKRQRVEGDGVLQMSQTGESSSVLDATTQPTRAEKGGRVIRGGKGSRGGSRGRGRGRGRGCMISEGESTECEGRGRGRGRGSGGSRGKGRRIPEGFIVFVAEDGTTLVNAPGQ
ncbi:DNA mismatch repair protein Msh3 [Bienertia sinuspersici]